jgi:hypothetical protein
MKPGFKLKNWVAISELRTYICVCMYAKRKNAQAPPVCVVVKKLNGIYRANKNHRHKQDASEIENLISQGKRWIQAIFCEQDIFRVARQSP